MNTFRKVFWVGAVAILVLPSYILAEQPVNNVAQPVDNTPCPEGKICNPLQADSLYEFIVSILDAVLRFGTILIVLAIIYSGFLFVRAQGNDEKLKEAKDTFTYVMVGAAIILGSWVLAQIVDVTIRGIRGV